MPKLSDLKETALYVDNMERSLHFYGEVMGLAILVKEPTRFCAIDIAGRHVLLLFLRGASNHDSPLPGGIIPPHDSAGPIHVGFSVDAEELPKWEAHFREHNVPILSEVNWPRGGRSIYFRDPDGHLLELLTPGVWAIY